MKRLFRWLAGLFAPPDPEFYSVVLTAPTGRVTAEVCPTLNMARSRLCAAQRAGTASCGEILTPNLQIVDSFQVTPCEPAPKN